MTKSLHEQAIDYSNERFLSMKARSRERTKAIIEAYLAFLAERGIKLMPHDLPDMMPGNIHPSFRTLYHQAHDAAPSPEDVS